MNRNSQPRLGKAGPRWDSDGGILTGGEEWQSLSEWRTESRVMIGGKREPGRWHIEKMRGRLGD